MFSSLSLSKNVWNSRPQTDQATGLIGEAADQRSTSALFNICAVQHLRCSTSALFNICAVQHLRCSTYGP
ncbi:MAG TPA: hypothetical protein VHC19_03450, partial [Pirellulales bacterium]|nr:hypothetical protein [Pirellulales bacterium]